MKMSFRKKLFSQFRCSQRWYQSLSSGNKSYPVNPISFSGRVFENCGMGKDWAGMGKLWPAICAKIGQTNNLLEGQPRFRCYRYHTLLLVLTTKKCPGFISSKAEGLRREGSHSYSNWVYLLHSPWFVSDWGGGEADRKMASSRITSFCARFIWRFHANETRPNAIGRTIISVLANDSSISEDRKFSHHGLIITEFEAKFAVFP